MTAGYLRVKSVMSQKEFGEGSFQSMATLIRPTEISMQMPDDYGLSKVGIFWIEKFSIYLPSS